MFQDVKKCAKLLKVTMNDLLTSCLSVSLKRYFKVMGDTETKDVDIAIPANIRFEHYKTIDQIKIENKVAFVDCNIPLANSIKESLVIIPPSTHKLKTSFLQTDLCNLRECYGISQFFPLLCDQLVCE